MLKQDYKEGEMTLSAALALAVKVLNKTMDVSKLSAEKGVCVLCVCARVQIKERKMQRYLRLVNGDACECIMHKRGCRLV